MRDLIQNIPPEFTDFLLVALFSLLIGLEQRRHNITVAFEKLFGTDRTFTLIGILGFILYIISPHNLLPFVGGGAVLSILLAIFYYQKINHYKRFGFTSIITALITYCLAPLLFTQPIWLVLLVVVSILVITEIKETLFQFSKKFDNNEFITLAKFLALAGVILPLLPDTPISPSVNISPFKFALTVVVVSGISYLSYLLKKFVFPNAGILLTGILGGLYSSTATTVILAKKSKEQPGEKSFVPAILLANTMMYLRILILAFFFNKDVAMKLLPWFLAFMALALAMTFIFYRIGIKEIQAGKPLEIKEQKNPLEFNTALLFAALFIFFSLATAYVAGHFGSAGINIMSFVVGVTDIDPFILNLFQHNTNITTGIIVIAVINAVSSNNLLKMIYSLVFADKALRKELIIAFGVLILAGLCVSVGLAVL